LEQLGPVNGRVDAAEDAFGGSLVGGAVVAGVAGSGLGGGDNEWDGLRAGLLEADEEIKG
jgi:hypothetical protein